MTSATSNSYRAPLTRGGPNQRRPGFQKPIRISGSNCSKPLPPDPPISPHFRRSSSVYSRASKAFSLQLSIPLLADSSPPSAPGSPFSILLEPMISQSLSPSSPSTCFCRTPSISTQSPSSINVELSTPMMTRHRYPYSGLWSHSPPVSPFETQIIGSCSPHVLYNQSEPINEACPYIRSDLSLARGVLDIAENTRDGIDRAFSSLYQFYIDGEYDGEVSPLQEQSHDETLRGEGNQEQKSRSTESPLSQVNRPKQLRSRIMDGEYEIQIDHVLSRPAPSKIPRLSHTASQKRRLMLDIKACTQQESTFCVQRQQATPMRSSDSRQLKETPLHHWSSTDAGDPSQRHHDSASRRHISKRIIEDVQRQISPLGSYSPVSHINSIPDSTPPIWQNLGLSNSLATDPLSANSPLNTVPKGAYFGTTISPLQNNPGQTGAEDGVYKSRFSVDSLARSKPKTTRDTLQTFQESLVSFSREGSLSFLSKILPYKSLHLETNMKKRKDRMKGSKKLENNVGFDWEMDPGIVSGPSRPRREAFREGWI
jgi:hypothetical protein